jgi:hypothetical protein
LKKTARYAVRVETVRGVHQEGEDGMDEWVKEERACGGEEDNRR